MPPKLRRAHWVLDEAVDRLYRRAAFPADHERVEHLFMLDPRIAEPLQSDGIRHNRRITMRRSGDLRLQPDQRFVETAADLLFRRHMSAIVKVKADLDPGTVARAFHGQFAAIATLAGAPTH